MLMYSNFDTQKVVDTGMELGTHTYFWEYDT
jgi:hypothetical protein